MAGSLHYAVEYFQRSWAPRHYKYSTSSVREAPDITNTMLPARVSFQTLQIQYFQRSWLCQWRPLKLGCHIPKRGTCLLSWHFGNIMNFGFCSTFIGSRRPTCERQDDFECTALQIQCIFAVRISACRPEQCKRNIFQFHGNSQNHRIMFWIDKTRTYSTHWVCKEHQ